MMTYFRMLPLSHGSGPLAPAHMAMPPAGVTSLDQDIDTAPMTQAEQLGGGIAPGPVTVTVTVTAIKIAALALGS